LQLFVLENKYDDDDEVVGSELRLRLGLDLVSKWLVVMHTYL